MDQFQACGTHRKIGRMIGEEYRNQIYSVLEILKTQLIPEMYGGEAYEKVAERFVRKTGAIDNFRRHAGELLNEITGMAEAADADMNDLMILNCLDEISSFSVQEKNIEKCTCIGIRRKYDDRVFIAQNLDVSACFDQYQIILHLKHDENLPEQLIFTIPGLLGFTGVNSQSVSVVPNAVSSLKCDWKGMPVTLIVRGILDQDCAVHAAEFVKGVTHGAAQNYTIGDRHSMFSFECSGSVKEEFQASDNQFFEYLVHTNHPLKNREISVKGKTNMPFSSYEGSICRLKTADSYLNEADHELDERDLEKLLTSHENEPSCICRHGGKNGNMTLGSVVYDLGDTIVMHFAKGPGCMNAYKRYCF